MVLNTILFTCWGFWERRCLDALVMTSFAIFNRAVYDVDFEQLQHATVICFVEMIPGIIISAMWARPFLGLHVKSVSWHLTPSQRIRYLLSRPLLTRLGVVGGFMGGWVVVGASLSKPPAGNSLGSAIGPWQDAGLVEFAPNKPWCHQADTQFSNISSENISVVTAVPEEWHWADWGSALN